jgi:hypothetical protein
METLKRTKLVESQEKELCTILRFARGDTVYQELLDMRRSIRD